MRILYSAIDQQVPGTKGGSTHVQAVAEGLAARGHELHVLATPGAGGFPTANATGGSPTANATSKSPAVNATSGFPGDNATSGRVVWHALQPPLGWAQLRLARRGAVRKVATAVRPDVVIERYYNFGGEGLLAARAVGARAVLEVNAPIIDYPGSPKQRLDRLLLVEPMRRWRNWQCRVANLIVTPTAAILPAWVPAARILETEWGADTELFRPDVTPRTLDTARAPSPRSPSGEMPNAGKSASSAAGAAGGAAAAADAAAAAAGQIVIIFIGAFRTWHGVHHLLQAMEQLRARGRRAFHAVLIGDGPERPRAQAQIEAARLDNVTLLGPRPHDEIPGYLAAADIGVAPFDVRAHAPLALTFYWSPLKIFEYMAAGLPVVAPDIPRLRAVVRPDEDGLLYDAARPDALADALERLADPTRRAALGAAARARVVQHFSWAAHCERLDAALRAMRL